MDYIIDTLPVFICCVVAIGLIYVYIHVVNKRLIRALEVRKYPASKKVRRIHIFEAMSALSSIDEEKADIAVNALIKKFGMGKLRWGHLNWAYTQVRSASVVTVSTMPNQDGN